MMQEILRFHFIRHGDAVILDNEAKVTDTDSIVLALLVGLYEAKPRRFLPFTPREIGVEKS